MAYAGRHDTVAVEERWTQPVNQTTARHRRGSVTEAVAEPTPRAPSGTRSMACATIRNQTDAPVVLPLIRHMATVPARPGLAVVQTEEPIVVLVISHYPICVILVAAVRAV